MKKTTLIDKLLVMLFRIPLVKNYWTRNFEALFFDHIPWTKLKKPLSECKIVLFTTGGIHLKSDEEFDLNVNESVFIPVEAIHRIANHSDTELQIIEVQCGDYLGEDDIERFKDNYGRVEG